MQHDICVCWCASFVFVGIVLAVLLSFQKPSECVLTIFSQTKIGLLPSGLSYSGHSPLLVCSLVLAYCSIPKQLFVGMLAIVEMKGILLVATFTMLLIVSLAMLNYSFHLPTSPWWRPWGSAPRSHSSPWSIHPSMDDMVCSFPSGNLGSLSITTSLGVSQCLRI